MQPCICPPCICSAQARKIASKGFTLLELLVATLIMTLSLGLFLGYNFRQRDMVQLRAAAQDVLQWMRASRGHALLEGQDNLGVYHVHEHRFFSALRDRSLVLPEAVQVDLAVEESRDAVPVFLFYADGSAQRSQVVLRIEDRVVKIMIDPVLGEAAIAW